jgi:PAS domain S-box-containing protein
MNATTFLRTNISERWSKGIILALSCAVLVLTIWYLTAGITVFFINLYYFPVVLIAYYYRRRGIPLILLLSGGYFLIAAYFVAPFVFEIQSAALSAGMLIIIGIIVAFLSDSLEKKHADYENLINNVQDIVYRTDDDGTITMASPSFAHLFGYASPEECLGMDMARDFYLNPEDRRHFLEKIAKDGQVTQYQVTLRHRNGQPVVVSASSHRYLGPDGKVRGVEGIFRDITRQQQLEQNLRENEEKFRFLVDNVKDVIWQTSADLTFTYLSPAAEAVTGFTVGELVGTSLLDLLTERSAADLRERVRRRREEFANSGQDALAVFELEIVRRDKSIIWVEVNSNPVPGPDGTLAGFQGVSRDITGRKRSDEMLRESRQLFMDIINFLPDPTFVIDHEGRVIAWNRAMEKLSGIGSREMIGRGNFEYSLWQYGKQRPILIDLVLNPDLDSARMDYTDIQRDGYTLTAQRMIPRPGGGPAIPFMLVASPLIDAKGKINGAIESMRDISRIKNAEAELARFNANLEKIIRERTQALQDEIVQRKYAEQEVQDTLAYTRSVIEANPDLMVVIDHDGTVLDVNAAAESLTGIPREGLIGTSYARYLVDDTTPTNLIARLLMKEKIEYTLELRRTDGHITPLSVRSTLFQGKDATDIRIIVAAHDITRQKADAAAIRASLNEKVLLLREIHHRVNNNLQIIISLTKLQIRTIEDPAMRQVLGETQNRVRAMSLVHEKLYQSENLSSINLPEYTRYLATQLFTFYGVERERVRLDIALDRVPLDIDTAIPLGLVLNELISNALRHAFPGGRSGALMISGRTEGDLLTLVVRDDGPGLSPDLDWKTTESLGFRLVNSLIDQLDGTIEMGEGAGTMFIITLHLKTYKREDL